MLGYTILWLETPTHVHSLYFKTTNRHYFDEHPSRTGNDTSERDFLKRKIWKIPLRANPLGDSKQETISVL